MVKIGKTTKVFYGKDNKYPIDIYYNKKTDTTCLMLLGTMIPLNAIQRITLIRALQEHVPEVTSETYTDLSYENFRGEIKL